MIFKQFFEPDTSTFTYLLACEKTKQAVLIDTVESEVPKYLNELEAQDLKLVYTLETHVHADHVTGADALRQKIGAVQVQMQEIKLNHINVYRKIKGKAEWQDIEMTLFDPITPSGAQAVMDWSLAFMY